MQNPLSPEHQQLLRRYLMIHRLPAFIFIGAIFLYGFILHSALNNPESSAATPSNILVFRLVMLGMGITTVALSPFLRKLLSKGQQSVPRQELTAAKMATVTNKLFIGLLVALALCEAAALYGLVLAFSTRNLYDFLALSILALGGILYHFPRYEQWEEWVITYSPVGS